jgi:hypothetical protein
MGHHGQLAEEVHVVACCCCGILEGFIIHMLDAQQQRPAQAHMHRALHSWLLL